MAWRKPEYRWSDVDSAGDILINPQATPEEKERALEIVNNWRFAHHYPLNTFQTGLRRKTKIGFPDGLIAQRIKRLPAIELKLNRFRDRGLKLSKIQDIGGCRAVVNTVAGVHKLVGKYKESYIKHKLDKISDYIQNPKTSGYRAIHLVYKYKSDKKNTYNNLKIEMQFRSKLQHIWATSVEVVDMFTMQSLKSSQGKEEWLRFFELMGSVIALQEKTPPIPNTPQDRRQLKSELRDLSVKLKVAMRLSGYTAALGAPPKLEVKDPRYFLLRLDLLNRKIYYKGYSRKQLEEANTAYSDAEKRRTPNIEDVVLVSVDSVEALTRAYRNYFLDTDLFIKLLRAEIGR